MKCAACRGQGSSICGPIIIHIYILEDLGQNVCHLEALMHGVVGVQRCNVQSVESSDLIDLISDNKLSGNAEGKLEAADVDDSSRSSLSIP